MNDYSKVPERAVIDKTISALKGNGFDAVFAKDASAALEEAKKTIPQGSEVFTMTSVTLESIGAQTAFNDSTAYRPVRDRLYAMKDGGPDREKAKLGAAPETAIGSVHAITEAGSIIIASMTGSQLAAYASGAAKVVFVVGAQKIVKDFESGLERIREYVLQKETIRARKAYGLPDTFTSAVNKMLVINGESTPSRIKVIIVGEALGF